MDDNKEKYKVAIDLVKYEGQMLWQIMAVFMVAQTILFSFIGNNIKDTHPNKTYCFIASCLGLILTIPWLGTFLRNTKYYHFRMAQAKNAELENWDLLKNDGEKFSKGDQVVFNDTDKHQLIGLSRFMKNKRAALFIIIAFDLAYIALIVNYWPFNCY